MFSSDENNHRTLRFVVDYFLFSHALHVKTERKTKMFKAYASFDNEDETNKTSRDGSTTDQNPPTGNERIRSNNREIILVLRVFSQEPVG